MQKTKTCFGDMTSTTLYIEIVFRDFSNILVRDGNTAYGCRGFNRKAAIHSKLSRRMLRKVVSIRYSIMHFTERLGCRQHEGAKNFLILFPSIYYTSKM